MTILKSTLRRIEWSTWSPPIDKASPSPVITHTTRSGRVASAPVAIVQAPQDAVRFVHELCHPERLAAHAVIPDRVDEEARPDEHDQLAQIHLWYQHPSIAPDDLLRVGRERVQVPQLSVGDAVTFGLQP